MSSQPRNPSWDESADLPGRVGSHPVLSMPEDWTYSTSWQRAQEETDHGGPINDAERMVALDDGDDYHRVLWALKGRTLLAECDCRGYEFHGLLVEGDNYHKVVSVLEMVEKGELSKRKAADRLDTSRPTINRALDRADLYGL
jgi:hypothetical protein